MFHPKAKELVTIDPILNNLILKEDRRQEEGLELIASENATSPAVMQAQGSILTNKYAEGFPKKRYYGGCEFIDNIEQLAIDRAKKLFKTGYANVQPHSGSSANMAAYFSLLKPGDKVLAMSLSAGGHLTHGSSVNFSGQIFNFSSYGVDPQTERIDYDLVEKIAVEVKPRLIIAGASSYTRDIDFKIFRQIADRVSAYLMVDMAHISGLVAAGLHSDPIPYAHIITSTTHKTLRGPRGGLILSNEEELYKKIDSTLFPGIQAGPLEHVIAGKAVCFLEASLEHFKIYQKNVLLNARVLAENLISKGITLVTNGTDNHQILIKTDCVNLSGRDSAIVLESAGITCNKNMIPYDTRSPFATSGIRLGTPAITTRGLKSEHMPLIATWIDRSLRSQGDRELLENIRQEIFSLCKEYPIYKF